MIIMKKIFIPYVFAVVFLLVMLVSSCQSQQGSSTTQFSSSDRFAAIDSNLTQSYFSHSDIIVNEEGWSRVNVLASVYENGNTYILVNGDGKYYIEIFDKNELLQTVDEIPAPYIDDHYVSMDVVDSELLISSSNENKLDVFSFQLGDHKFARKMHVSYTDGTCSAYFHQRLLIKDNIIYALLSDSKETTCLGYDLSKGELKFKTEIAGVENCFWINNQMYALCFANGTDKYEIYEVNERGKAKSSFNVSEKELGIWKSTFHINENLYAENEDGLWLLDDKTMSWTNLVSWINSGRNNAKFITDARYYVTNNDTIIVYSIFEPVVQILHREDKNPNENKTIIRIGGVGIKQDESLLWAAQEFNQSETAYFIEIVDYIDLLEKEKYTDKDGDYDYSKMADVATETLWKEVANGTGPDLLLRHASGENKYDAEYLEFGGFLLDQYPLWQKEDESWKRQIYSNIVEAMRMNGCLFSMPINGLPHSRLIKMDQSFPEICDYVSLYTYLEKNANGRFLCRESKENFLRSILSINLLDFIDVKENKSCFQSEDFHTLLKMVDKYCPTQKQYDTGSLPVDDELYILIDDEEVYNFQEIGAYQKRDDEYRNCGIPSQNGGTRYFSPNIVVSITSCSKSVEGAWDFVKLLLTPSFQEYYMRLPESQIYWYPVRIDSLDYLLDFPKNPDKHQEYYWNSGYPEEEWKQYAKSEIEIEDFKREYSTINKVAHTDLKITEVVLEEAAAFFEGQKTLEEVTSIIDNRVQIILDERS